MLELMTESSEERLGQLNLSHSFSFSFDIEHEKKTQPKEFYGSVKPKE